MNLVDFLSQLNGRIMIKSLDGTLLFRGDVGELYGADDYIDVDFRFDDEYGTLREYEVYEAYASSNYIVICIV